MKAKVGEYYRHKWNKYISKVIAIKKGHVELITLNSGVSEYIHIDNFDMNYEPCNTIYELRPLIESSFSFSEIQTFVDCVRIKVNNTVIDFSIDYNNRFTVCFTDDVKHRINAEKNVLKFLLDDADEVISMFAEFCR